jgi:hypothetical protein
MAVIIEPSMWLVSAISWKEANGPQVNKLMCPNEKTMEDATVLHMKIIKVIRGKSINKEFPQGWPILFQLDTIRFTYNFRSRPRGETIYVLGIFARTRFFLRMTPISNLQTVKLLAWAIADPGHLHKGFLTQCIYR